MNDQLSRVVLAAVLAWGLTGTALASELKITTDPNGATVQLDGVSHGPAPVTIPEVGRGSHTLKVSMEGYVTREDVLDVDGESDFQIHAPLNPAPKLPPPQPPPAPRTSPSPQPQLQPQPRPATPVVTPPPPPAAQAQPQGPVPVSQLPVAWGTQKKTLVLLVETEPAQAFVQVVGMQEVKRAPATFTGFSPGTIQLQVRAPGYKDKKVEVDLQHDARTRVVLDPL